MFKCLYVTNIHIMNSNFQVYGYARKFAKIGIAGALVDSIRMGLSSPSLVSGSIALKAVAVNVRTLYSVQMSSDVYVLAKLMGHLYIQQHL